LNHERMEEKLHQDIIYSEPVNEIMGHPPRKILEYGNIIVLVSFVFFISLLWLIKYPDTIPAPVEITTVNPPVTLVSKQTGRIKNLLVKDKDEIETGKLIAVMETAASIDDINNLKTVIDTIKDPEKIEVVAIGSRQRIYEETFRLIQKKPLKEG